MRTRWWKLVLVFSLAVNAAFLGVCAYRYYCYTYGFTFAPCPLSPGERYLYRSLSLSDSQLKEMEPIARTFHTSLGKLSRQIERKRELLVNLLSREQVDARAIEDVQKDMAVIQDRIQREVIAHILDMKKILNAEQESRFFQLLRKSMKQESNLFPAQGG